MTGERAHELSETEVEELLGAYALDACEPDETAAIEAVLARRPDLAREAERLSGVAAWLGAAEAAEPPGRMPRPRARPRSSAPVGERRPGDRRVPVVVGAPRAGHRRSARRRARRGHTERAHRARPGRAHGRAGEPARAEPRHAHRSTTSTRKRSSPAPTRCCRVSRVATSTMRSRSGATRWRRTGRGPSPTPTAPRSGAASGSPATTRCSCARSRRGCTPMTFAAPRGCPAHAPEVRHLSLMSDLARRILPLALAVVGREHDGRTARLVLTGDGGGDWLVPMGAGNPDAPPDVTVTADVVDWCLSRRRPVAPDALRVRSTATSRSGATSSPPRPRWQPSSQSRRLALARRGPRRLPELGLDGVDLGDDPGDLDLGVDARRRWCPTSARRPRRRALPSGH